MRHLPPLAASNIANVVMIPKIFVLTLLTSYQIAQHLSPESVAG